MFKRRLHSLENLNKFLSKVFNRLSHVLSHVTKRTRMDSVRNGLLILLHHDNERKFPHTVSPFLCLHPLTQKKGWPSHLVVGGPQEGLSLAWPSLAIFPKMVSSLFSVLAGRSSSGLGLQTMLEEHFLEQWSYQMRTNNPSRNWKWVGVIYKRTIIIPCHGGRHEKQDMEAQESHRFQQHFLLESCWQ